jgi:5-oxoprolinase (ATP-hydrolysing) subunit A
MRVDLNCDMGEGAGQDELLMPFISSANIACGAHAGDRTTMRATVVLALGHGVAIGAHPGFEDRDHFGRSELMLPLADIYALVHRQIVDLMTICLESGTRLHHVKAHGALYNMSARDAAMAATIARAVHDVDKDLIVYGLRGSFHIMEASRLGLRTATEVFADRTYKEDGSLTPRTEANALIETVEGAVAQALRMAARADTICLHGDGPHAVGFATAIHDALKTHHIDIAAPR